MKFFESRLVNFENAAKPELSSDALSGLKDKKEASETAELSVDQLVADSNKILGSYADQVSQLPPEFSKSLHDNIVQYFLTSADRYDKDSEQGLDAMEFGKYSQDMLAKLVEILDTYAPSKEQLEAREKQRQAADEAKDAVEAAEGVSIDDFNFDQANLQTPEGIEQELTKYNKQGGDFREKMSKLIGLVGNFQQSCQKFEDGKKGWGVFLRGNGFFGLNIGSSDRETDALNSNLGSLKSTIGKVLPDLETKQKELTDYGDEMNQAGDSLRQRTLTEREQKLAEIDSQGVTVETTQKKNEEQYLQLSQRQEELSSKKLQLDEYAQGLQVKYQDASDELQRATVQADELKAFDGQLGAAIGTLDGVLQNPNLPEEQKKAIEERRAELLEGKEVVSNGLMQSDDVLGEVGVVKGELVEGISDVQSEAVDVEAYLAGLVLPAVDSIESSLKSIELAKLKNGTQREQVEASYIEKLDAIDNVDAVVADSVLQNSLVNQKMIDSLTQQKHFLDTVEIDRPGVWDATGGLLLGKIGEGWGMISNDVLDPLGGWVKDITKDTVIDWAGVIVANIPIGLVSGVCEGVGELISGVNMLVAHPLDTAVGMGALIGRNPSNGEWSFGTAGNSWKEFGKALLAWDEFADGNVGKGFGKFALNVALTATGAGAAAKAVTPARALYISLRAGAEGVKGMGVAYSGLRAGLEFSKVFAVEFSSGVAKIPGETISGVSRAVRSVPKMKALLSREAVRSGVTASKDMAADWINSYKINRRLSGTMKKEVGFYKEQAAHADDYVKFDAEVKTMVSSGLTRERAIYELSKTKPELVASALRYEKAAKGLVELQAAREAQIFGPDLQSYSAAQVEFGRYADEAGSMVGLMEREGVIVNGSWKKMKSEARLRAFEELRGKVTSADDIAKVERLTNMERLYGARLDKANAAASKLKQCRGENYNFERDAEFSRYALEHGVDNILEADLQVVERLKKAFIEQKTDELFEAVGIDVARDLQRMDSNLYNSVNGMQRLDTSVLATADEATIRASFRNHVEQFATGPNAEIGLDSARLIQGQLDEVLTAARQAGVEGEALVRLLDDCSNKMIHQTIETYKRQLGDHGIRHIAGNIRANQQIFDAYETIGVKITAQDRLDMMIAHVNHDMAYTTPVNLDSFGLTGTHSLIGARYMDQAAAVSGAVGDRLGRIKQAIFNHDGVEVLDVVGLEGQAARDVAFMNGMKFADNLALFSYDKLPEVFLRNEECMQILTQIETAMNMGRIDQFPLLKNQMRRQLLKMQAVGELSVSETRYLLKAVDEVSDKLTAKSTIGMLAGKHGDQVFTFVEGTSVPYLLLDDTPVFAAMEKALIAKDTVRFDASTSQFLKMLGDYAKKNGCEVKIGERGALLAGDALDAGGADVVSKIQLAIASGDDLRFITTDGRELMRVRVGASRNAEVVSEMAALDADFINTLSGGGSRGNILGKISTRIDDVKNEIASLESRIRNGESSLELSKDVIAKRMELRRLHDMQIAGNILTDTVTIRALRDFGKAEELIKTGNQLHAFMYIRRIASGFPTEVKSEVFSILDKVKSGQLSSEVAMKLCSDKLYGSIFSKYDVRLESSRIRIKQYLSSANTIGQASGDI